MAKKVAFEGETSLHKGMELDETHVVLHSLWISNTLTTKFTVFGYDPFPLVESKQTMPSHALCWVIPPISDKPFWKLWFNIWQTLDAISNSFLLYAEWTAFPQKKSVVFHGCFSGRHVGYSHDPALWRCGWTTNSTYQHVASAIAVDPRNAMPIVAWPWQPQRYPQASWAQARTGPCDPDRRRQPLIPKWCLLILNKQLKVIGK